MTLFFWSLAALLAFELAAAQPLFGWERVVGSCTHTCGSMGIRPSLILCRGPSGGSVDETICDSFTKPPYQPPEPCNRFSCFRWSRIVGSCTHTCGPFGVKPSLVICFGSSGTVDEVNCDRNTKPPYQAPEECNRSPCPEPPQIEVPPSFVQNSPIPGGDITIEAGQNVQIHAGNSLWIETNFAKPGFPPPTFLWSLPGNGTLNSSETSGRLQIHNGTLVITNITLDDEGDYEVTASNVEGADKIASSVTVLSYRWNITWIGCPATCEPGRQSDSIFCINVKSGGAVVNDSYCQHLDKPSPKLCYSCGVLPKFFVPPSFTTIDIGQKVVIKEGDRLFIRAHLLQGTPDPIVSWTLPDGSILKKRRDHIFVKRNGTLEVKRIQLADWGRYTATATNRVGNVTAVSLVTVVP